MKEDNTSYPSYQFQSDGREYSKEFRYSPITARLDELHNKAEELTLNDIHEITLWKINRFPSITAKTLKDLDSLKHYTTLDEKRTRDILQDLLASNGVRLPMASTYLRFVNPNVYQIIDVRAFRAAYKYEKSPNCIYSKSNKTCIDIYIDYLKRLKEIENNGYYGIKEVDFRNLDRLLYDLDKDAKFNLDTTWKNPKVPQKTIQETINKYKAKYLIRG